MDGIRYERHVDLKKPRKLDVKDKDRLSQKNGTHSTIYLINGDRYIGEWRDNKRHGKGTHYYKSSGHTYMGEWQNDLRHGYGIFSIPEKAQQKTSKKESMFSKTEPTKMANAETQKLRKVYTGLWMNDVRHGTGTYFYPDSSVYEGSWVNDMRQGWGKMTYADGSIYEGEWHHETRHGQGTLLLKNGDRYEGMWFDNEKEGPGKFIYLTKRQCYKGEWSKGQPRCGTIQNLSNLAGYPGTIYPIPPIQLEDPQKVLDGEKELIYQSRAKRLVGGE
ncbi:hypothetical protein BC833DRAFT_584970 [Globomyces pollinis-pini]|nr:hypothetical protein BC833DRAFT_584970 [Globomyces pollinis-pini]KAJ2999479.1 hypothetical protein HDV02_002792 [Globomyces sp. JEL0801]